MLCCPSVFSFIVFELPASSDFRFGLQETQELGYVDFLLLSVGDFHHEAIELRLRIVDLNSIEVQEDQCRSQCSPFVSVYEWVVLTNVKCIGGGLFKEPLMEILPFERSRRHRQGRAQQGRVPYPVASSISADLVLKNNQNLSQCEKADLQELLAEFFEDGTVPTIDPFKALQQTCLSQGHFLR